MQRLALSAIVGKASKDAMLIVLEVASGPPWRAGIWALAPALTLSMGSASSGGRWFRRGRRDQGGSTATIYAVPFPGRGNQNRFHTEMLHIAPLLPRPDR